MIRIAHRGFFDLQNTIIGITKVLSYVDIVEIDVRYNTKREIVLCHDREKRNNENQNLHDLLKINNPMNLMIDIKAFGTIDAVNLANDIHNIIIQYPIHNYYYVLLMNIVLKNY
jgi:glycerophosphoryl diester phosphodiesterase